MSVLLDLSIPIIFGLVVFIVIKRGFVKSVMHIVSFVGSLIVAKLFTPVVSPLFYDLLNDRFASKMNEAVGNYLKNNSKTLAEGNDTLSKLIQRFDISLSESADALSSGSEKLTSMLISAISTALAFIVVFIVAFIAFKLLTLLLQATVELPGLKTVNKALGAVLGVVLGFLYVLLFTALLQLIIPFMSSYHPDVLNESMVEKTHIFKFFYNMDWIGIFVN